MEHLLCHSARYNSRMILQFLLSPYCVAGQSGARPTVYVRGIIRISYGAARGEGVEVGRRSAVVGCRGTESVQMR